MAKKHKHKESSAKAVKESPKKDGKVTFAKKLGIRQIIAIVAVLLLILNLVLFSMGKMPSLAFWVILIVIWGAAYLAIRFIKQ